MNIMPRGKFIQTILLDILSACGATAVNLLALYCSTKARQNTTAPGDEQRYNSSASAVCAIWLIVQMYVCGVIKAKGASHFELFSISNARADYWLHLQDLNSCSLPS